MFHTCIDTSFIFMVEKYFVVCMYQISFIHSSLDGHLGYFHFGAWKKLCVMLLWTFVLKFLCEHVFSSLLGTHSGLELLRHMVTVCLIFWGTGKQFSKATAPFYVPTSKVWEFQFLYFLPNTCYWPSF